MQHNAEHRGVKAPLMTSWRHTVHACANWLTSGRLARTAVFSVGANMEFVLKCHEFSSSPQEQHLAGLPAWYHLLRVEQDYKSMNATGRRNEGWIRVDTAETGTVPCRHWSEITGSFCKGPIHTDLQICTQIRGQTLSYCLQAVWTLSALTAVCLHMPVARCSMSHMCEQSCFCQENFDQHLFSVLGQKKTQLEALFFVQTEVLFQRIECSELNCSLVVHYFMWIRPTWFDSSRFTRIYRLHTKSLRPGL